MQPYELQLDKQWSKAKVAAFWDRPKMTYTDWINAIQSDGVKSSRTLKQSMLYMNAKSFACLVGIDNFAHHYPQWRSLIEEEGDRARIKRILLDSQWASQVCGVAIVRKPSTDWFTLTQKQKDTFYCITKHNFSSIYAIAKILNRNYRRVFDDVKKLTKSGLIQSCETTRNNRKTTLLWH